VNGEAPKRASSPFAALREKLGPLPAGPQPPSGAAQPDATHKRYTGRVTVRRERAGRGGKAVTLAEGPGLSGHPLEKLAKELAKALGTGARVEGTSIVVQGDQPERLAAALEERGFANVTRGN